MNTTYAELKPLPFSAASLPTMYNLPEEDNGEHRPTIALRVLSQISVENDFRPQLQELMRIVETLATQQELCYNQKVAILRILYIILFETVSNIMVHCFGMTKIDEQYVHPPALGTGFNPTVADDINSRKFDEIGVDPNVVFDLPLFRDLRHEIDTIRSHPSIHIPVPEGTHSSWCECHDCSFFYPLRGMEIGSCLIMESRSYLRVSYEDFLGLANLPENPMRLFIQTE